jgi:hypothetical protein
MTPRADARRVRDRRAVVASALMLLASAVNASPEPRSEPVPFESILVEGGYGGFLDLYWERKLQSELVEVGALEKEGEVDPGAGRDTSSD